MAPLPSQLAIQAAAEFNALSINPNDISPTNDHVLPPCKFTQLPIELRLEIYEYTIPDGPTSRPASEYTAALNLMSASRLFNTEISALLFNSSKKRLVVQIKDGGLTVFDRHFEPCAAVARRVPSFTTMGSLHSLGLQRFRYVDVHVQSTLVGDETLLDLLEAMRHLFDATKLMKTYDESGRLTTSKCSTIKEVMLSITVHGYSYPHPGFLMEQLFAQANAILAVTKMSDYVKPQIIITLRRKHSKDIVIDAFSWQLKMYATVPSARTESITDRLRLSTQQLLFRKWLEPSLPWQRQSLTLWAAYKEYCMLLENLTLTGLLGQPQYYSLKKFCHNAQSALENRDIEGLTLLRTCLLEFWQKKLNGEVKAGESSGSSDGSWMKFWLKARDAPFQVFKSFHDRYVDNSVQDLGQTSLIIPNTHNKTLAIDGHATERATQQLLGNRRVLFRSSFDFTRQTSRWGTYCYKRKGNKDQYMLITPTTIRQWYQQTLTPVMSTQDFSKADSLGKERLVQTVLYMKEIDGNKRLTYRRPARGE